MDFGSGEWECSVNLLLENKRWQMAFIKWRISRITISLMVSFCCWWKHTWFAFDFLCPSHCMTCFSQFLRLLMHMYFWATLRECESLPKLCVGGPFLSKLHSPETLNINLFFPSDLTAGYLWHDKLWTPALEIVKNVKKWRKKSSFRSLHTNLDFVTACFTCGMYGYSFGGTIPSLMLNLSSMWKGNVRIFSLSERHICELLFYRDVKDYQAFGVEKQFSRVL